MPASGPCAAPWENQIDSMTDSSRAGALSRLKASEEAKRNAAYDPATRWRHIQQTIAWAEASLPPAKRRNRPRRRPPAG